MPSKELLPTGTAVVAAGWGDPTNAYTYNNTYATCSTDNAEQSYTYAASFSEDVIDRVFVKIKFYNTLAAVLGGDDATLTFSVKVYDGTSWTTYQVTKLVYNCTTINGESFTSIDGDDSNSTVAIDCTSVLDTAAKINSAQTSLLMDFTKDAALTLTLSVDCVSLLVCYHTVGDVFIGQAKTKQNLQSRGHRALEAVNNFFTVTS